MLKEAFKSLFKPKNQPLINYFSTIVKIYLHY